MSRGKDDIPWPLYTQCPVSKSESSDGTDGNSNKQCRPGPRDVLSIFPPQLNSVAGSGHPLAPAEAPNFPHKLSKCLLTIKNF